MPLPRHWRRSTGRSGPRWAIPDFPFPPQDEPSLLVVDDAFLSKVGHGPLASVKPPRRWLRGAVYDGSGKLVKSSQKLGGVGGRGWVPADPGRVRVPSSAERLPGRWLYGGHWIQHFGHFVIETITTLWPREQVDGLVFHKYLKRPWSVEDWQARLLDLAGYGGLPVRVVDGSRPLVVEQLVVPSRAIVADGWGHRQALDVWGRVASGVTAPAMTSRVYLSRSAHNKAARLAGQVPRTSREHDLGLDRVFGAARFDVVAPESLPVEEQIGLAMSAEIIAGTSGSALHLSAFAPSGTRVLEIGDSRTVTRPVPMQLVIDAVCGHEHAYVRGDVRLDALPRALRELGLRR